MPDTLILLAGGSVTAILRCEGCGALVETQFMDRHHAFHETLLRQARVVEHQARLLATMQEGMLALTRLVVATPPGHTPRDCGPLD